MDAPHRKRFRRWNHPGHAHFLTFSCFRRQPFLSKDRSREWMLDALKRAQAKYRFDLWAWVFMPEHVHVLFKPNHEFFDVSAIEESLKKSVTKRAGDWVRLHAPEFAERMRHRLPSGREHLRFWQPGPGYDRNLWSRGEIDEKIRYIHLNPIRRGLCLRPVDWPWSSAADYQRLRDPPWAPLNLSSLPWATE